MQGGPSPLRLLPTVNIWRLHIGSAIPCRGEETRTGAQNSQTLRRQLSGNSCCMMYAYKPQHQNVNTIANHKTGRHSTCRVGKKKTSSKKASKVSNGRKKHGMGCARTNNSVICCSVNIIEESKFQPSSMLSQNWTHNYGATSARQTALAAPGTLCSRRQPAASQRPPYFVAAPLCSINVPPECRHLRSQPNLVPCQSGQDRLTWPAQHRAQACACRSRAPGG